MPRCPNGSRRNKKTGKCEKYTHKNKNKKVCPEDKILNLKTNRCIKNNTINKNKLGSKKVKICPEGKILNLKTNRCIKNKQGIVKSLPSILKPSNLNKTPFKTSSNLIFMKNCSIYNEIGYIDINNVKLIKTPPNSCKSSSMSTNTNNFKFVYNNVDLCNIKFLNKGAYGMVHQYSGGGYNIAVKSYFNKNDGEIKISKLLNKLNIPCKIVNSKLFKRGNEYVAAMELMNGPLSKMKGKFVNTNLMLVIKEIASHLKCLNDNNLVYTDLKTANILFKCIGKEKISVCLGDIGGICQKNSTNACTFLPWEYRYSGGFPKCDEKIMVWCLGVVLLELLNINTDIFHWSEIKYKTHTDITKKLNSIYNSNKIKILKGSKQNPEDLLKVMLNLDPNIRCSLNYIIKNIV
tara:strand:+ start:5009 stop:6223 length:1215 start_codon:yes stop_codon:yes gene_type:complete